MSYRLAHLIAGIILFSLLIPSSGTALGSKETSFPLDVCDPDILAPEVTCAEDRNESFDESCAFTIPDYSSEITATDDCDLDLDITQSPLPGTVVFANTTITLTATDDAGNNASCSFEINLIDDTPPNIADCAEDQLIYLDDLCSATLLDWTSLITVDDACDSDLEIVQTPSPGSTTNHDLAVNFTITDDAGNFSSCSINVSVSDTTSPVLDCIEDQILYLDESCEVLLPDWTSELNAQDNCDDLLNITQTPIPGTILTENTEIVFTANDLYGNESNCSINVILEDTIAPEITCPFPKILYFDDACELNLSDWTGEILVADNCSPSLDITQLPSSGTTIFEETLITFTATDLSGNEAQCSINVTPLDTISPVVICPSNQTLFADESCEATLLDWTGDVLASDNCDSDLEIIQSPIPNTIIDESTQVTITVIDNNGLADFCTFDVNVVDTLSPLITCPDDMVIPTDPGSCDAQILVPVPIITDNCEIDYVINDYNSTEDASDLYPEGTHSLTWTVYDVSGNTATCQQEIIIEDQEIPEVICLENQTVYANESCQAILPDYTTEIVASDGCDFDLEITQSPSPGILISGFTIVSFTIEDDSENISNCSLLVSVLDTLSPSIECPEDITINTDIGACNAFVSIDQPVVDDNCFVNTIVNNFTFSNDATGTYSLGETEILWTVSDGSDNLSTCTQTVTILDGQAPKLTCNNDTTAIVDEDCNFILPDYSTIVPSSDFCDGLLPVVQSPLAGTILSDTTEVTFTSEDAAGNIGTCSFLVFPLDTLIPEITCPSDLFVNTDTDHCGATISIDTPMVSDNCQIDYWINDFNATDDASDFYPLGNTSIEWTVFDATGLSATCFQNIEVVDAQAPEITCIEDQILNADENCSAILPDYTDLISATDFCDSDVQIIQSPLAGSEISGPTEIFFTAIDDAANEDNCSIFVSIIDLEVPEIICPEDLTINTEADLCTAYVNIDSPTTEDNCGIASFTNDYNDTEDASDTYPIGETLVTWTVTDLSGNLASCTQTITVVDNQSPEIICPEDIAVEANENCQFELPDYTDQVSTIDNCELPVFITQNPEPGTLVEGISSITFTATDSHSNSSTCAIQIEVIDNTLPEITCGTTAISTTNLGLCTGVVIVDSPVVSDNCEVLSIVNDYNSTDNASDTYPIGTTVVTWTVTDLQGNTASCEQSVIVNDEEAPEIVCPEDKIEYADNNCIFELIDYTPEVVAADNCDPDVIITQFPLPGTMISDGDQVTFAATDISGNQNTCSISISVLDTILPQISCPADVTVFTDEDDCGAFVNLNQPVVTDNCGIDQYTNNITFNADASATYPIGTTEIVWTVADNSGNISSCTQLVTVVDGQAPDLICPEDKILFADENCESLLEDYTSEILATDNCDLDIEIEQSPAPGTFVNGENIINFTATDAAGNISNCSIQLSIIDTVPPTIDCPEAIITSNDEDLCTGYVTIGTPTSADNCSVFSVINDFNNTSDASDNYPVGTTVITWTVTDTSGNSSFCTQEITVNDEQAPSISCIEDQIAETNADCQFEIPDYTDEIIGSDNCDDELEIIQTPAPGTLISFETTITFTAIDDYLNESSCSFQLSLIDNIAPNILVIQNDTVIDSGLDCAYVLEDFTGTIEAEDNCDDDLVYTQSPEIGTVFDEINNTYIIDLTATDNSGNSSTQSFTILVTDTIAPVIECPADLSGNTSPFSCNSLISTPGPTVSENCGLFTVSNDYNNTNNASDFYPEGTTEVLWTVTDQYDNSSTCVQTITVFDLTEPEISCFGNVTGLAPLGSCEVFINVFSAAGNDYCGDPVVVNDYTGTDSASAIYPVGTTVLTWSATDASGNVATCTQNITVIDLVGPEIECPSDTVVYSDFDSCEYELVIDQPLVTDDCGFEYLTNNYNFTDDASDVYAPGFYEINWEVSDQYGNLNFCSHTIEVIDTVAPVLVCNDTTLVTYFFDAFELNPFTLVSDVYDNCALDSLTMDATLDIIDLSAVGYNDVVVSVFDVNGNGSTCETTVYVLNDVEPTAICQEELDVFVDELGIYELNALEVDDGSFDNNAIDSYEISITDFSCEDIGDPLEVILTLTDDAGLTSTCTSQITVLDTISPDLECQNITVYLTENGNFILGDEPISLWEDNCQTGDYFYDLPVLDCSHLGVITETLLVNDIHGNESTCTFEVTVLDTLAPVIIDCSSINDFFTSDTTCGDWVNMNEIMWPVFEENCEITSLTSGYFNAYTGLDINFVNPPDTLFYFELTNEEIIWVFEDQSGNISECTSTFTMTDLSEPIINGPDDIIIFLPEETCEYYFEYELDSDQVFDNCGVLNYTPNQEHEFFGTDMEFTAYQAYDVNENFNTEAPKQYIVVLDTIAPVINCQDTITYYTSIESCFVEVDIEPADYLEDPCIDYMLFSEPLSETYGPGVYDFEWTVSDQTVPNLIEVMSFDEDIPFDFYINENNQAVFEDTLIFDYSSSCTQVIQVLDTINPWVVGLEDEIEILTVEEPIEVTIDVPTFLDNCAIDSIGSNLGEENLLDSLDVTSDFNIGTHTITWTVTDIYGNESSYETILTILDNGAPEFMDCIESFEIESDENCEFEVPDFSSYFTILDNIEDIITVTQSIPMGTILTDDTEITITATDLLGNTGTCSFTLVNLDVIAPSIECEDTIYSCASILDEYLPTYDDNCSSALATDVLVGDDLYSDWSILQTDILTDTTSIEFFVEDQAGNINSCISTYIPLEDHFEWASLPSSICALESVELVDNADDIWVDWSTTLSETEIVGNQYTSLVNVLEDEVDIVTASVCDVDFSQNIEIVAYPVIELPVEDEICFTDSLALSATVSIYDNISWELENPSLGIENITETDVVLLVLNDLYVLENINIGITANNGACGSEENFEIAVYESPENFTFSAGSDKEIFNQNEITLEGEFDGANDFFWTVLEQAGPISIVDEASLTPTIRDLSIGDYVFELSVHNGVCPVASDTVTITNSIHIPNGISPDMNGIGDYFFIPGLENAKAPYKLTIINRWGDVVFETENYQNDWYGLNNQGDPLIEGTYYYLLTDGEHVFTDFVIIKYQ